MNKAQLLNVADVLCALADSIRTACADEQSGSTQVSIAESGKPSVTLEQVRGVLSEKSRLGFSGEVKALIRKYGAERLSDISPDHFPDMLKEAEEIGNA